MILATSARLFDEMERRRLRFACEDCAHLAEDRAACSLGYPNDAHRASAPRETGELVFCKEFELR